MRLQVQEVEIHRQEENSEMGGGGATSLYFDKCSLTTQK